MKIFVYKVIFTMICLFFLFNFTIGYQIRKIENNIENISSKEQITNIKGKIREELKNGLKKERILNDEDRVLISNFLKKIINELELKDK